MSTLKVNNLQVGQDATASNNFTLYQPAVPDGTVRLGVGNSGSVTDALILRNNSELILGTTTTGGALRVYGSSGRLIVGDTGVNYYDASSHNFRDYSSFASRLYITSDGNVLVGNTATGSLGGIQSALQVDRPSSSVLNASILIRENEANTSWPKLYLSKNRSDNPMGPDNKLGSIEFYGDNGSNDELGARIEATADGTTFWNTSSRPTRLVFSVTNGGTTLTEALRIDPTGNVGIGTTNPLEKLHVSDSIQTNVRIYAGDVTSKATNGVYKLQVSSGTSPTYQVTDGSDVAIKVGSGFIWNVNASGSYNGMRIGTNFDPTVGIIESSLPAWDIDIGGRNAAETGGDCFTVRRYGTSWVNYFSVRSTGNVGIGTTNPSSKLHVEGSCLITNNSFVSGYTKVGAWVTKTWNLASPLDGNSAQYTIHSTTANNIQFIHGEVIIMPSRSGLNQQRGHVRYAISYSFYNGNLYGYITELERTGVVGFSNLTLTSGVVSGTTANIYVNATSNTAAIGGIHVKFEGILYGH